MAGFVMMALIAGLIVYISIAKQKKRAVLISVVLIGSFFLYVNYSCGPNRADVKVMKPMAEKISAYIIKHGIPESLKDIPDLPYRLEGCEKKMYYLNKASKIVNDEQYASELHIKEICRIKYDIKIEQRIDKMFVDSKEIFVQISFQNKKTETGAVVSWSKDIDSNHFMLFQKLKLYSGKSSGICNPMRQ